MAFALRTPLHAHSLAASAARFRSRGSFAALTRVSQGASSLGFPYALTRSPLRRLSSVRLARSLRSLASAKGLRPSDSPTRSLARRFGSLPPPPRLQRDIAEALRAKAGRVTSLFAASASR